jgi:predicted DNA-binding protein (MmcQ/YjbR family)
MSMDVDQLKAFCMSLPGASAHEHDAPANILVYSVGGKRFAHFKTSAPEQWRFSFKVPAERFLELTDMPGVKPARWLGRYHWVTVVDVRRFPAAMLRDGVRWSYGEALRKLPRKIRDAINGD